MNFHYSFPYSACEKCNKSQILQDLFHSNFDCKWLLHTGKAGTEGKLETQVVQSNKQDFQRAAFAQNRYLLPSTCTGWWNLKWQTLNVSTESAVWAASIHWARRLRELAALDNSRGVRGVSSCCPRAVWLPCTACCNPQSKRFTTFSTPAWEHLAIYSRMSCSI